MNVNLPEFSMVMMVGASSSGKSTLAQRLFAPTEVVSSDHCRALAADDPNNQEASRDAFDILHTILRARLKNMRLALVDATNLQHEYRKELLQIARENDCHVTAIVMDTPIGTVLERNRERPERDLPEGRLRHQQRLLRRSMRGLRKEGFRHVVTISSPAEAEELTITRTPMPADKRHLKGPFDIIGDVHGCHDEMMELLYKLGYHLKDATGAGLMTHPEGRIPVFLGDLVDRGPGSDQVLETVMRMCREGNAICVEGNHENKLRRQMDGGNVQVTHGLERTLEQLANRDDAFRERVREFLQGLRSHYILDGGNLAVAHAGIREEYQGRASGRVRAFCLYGETTGETDEWGLPVRLEWANEYRGETAVVYGHTPVGTSRWVNNTLCIDNGCVFGGNLTALRYPERDLVSVPARETYYESRKPITPQEEEETTEGPPENAAAISLSTVDGSRDIVTALQGNVKVGRKQAAAALETMSRFALDPRWLVYMPPTISPTQTSRREGLLEHPQEAFDQYRQDGIETVICQEKHMGSRAVLIVGRDQEAIHGSFGIQSPVPGACYSRTGRKFFNDPGMEAEIIGMAQKAIQTRGMWESLETDWLILDCEIMPWSLKAQRMIENDFAPTGGAAANTLLQTTELLRKARERGLDTGELDDRTRQRLKAAMKYREAYRPYCWKVAGARDISIAPFHILAARGRTFTDRDHQWHMDIGWKLMTGTPGLFRETQHMTVRLDRPGEMELATTWWEGLTRMGQEGMVVKPLDFIPNGKHAGVQPAVKVRGPEYLRIIYGPEYDLPGNIERMRGRGLRTKQNMALREFALSIEGLERFAHGEPLERVHECAFGVLALESEPVDPRL